MSELSADEIRHIARLSRISVSDDTLEQMRIDVGRVLHLVDELQAAQTEGVKPTSQVTGLYDVLRADEVKSSPVSPDELLQRAPRQANGYIIVKRVLQ